MPIIIIIVYVHNSLALGALNWKLFPYVLVKGTPHATLRICEPFQIPKYGMFLSKHSLVRLNSMESFSLSMSVRKQFELTPFLARLNSLLHFLTNATRFLLQKKKKKNYCIFLRERFLNCGKLRHCLSLWEQFFQQGQHSRKNRSFRYDKENGF